MRIACSLPFTHPDGTSLVASEVMSWARKVEALGFDGIWLPDVVGRGYRANGSPYASRSDALMWLLLAGAATQQIELGTAVLQVPVRARVDLAQRMLTLHTVTKGRFVAGVGAGSSPPDFAGAGVEFDKRFTILRENLDVMRRLWRGEDVDGSNLRPAPNALGGPPIMIGAWVSGLWIKRAARDYNGWIASGGGGPRGTSFKELKEGINRFRDEGGKRAALGSVGLDLSVESAVLTDEMSFNLRCRPEEARDRVGKLADLGFDDLLLRNDNLSEAELEAACESLQIKPRG